MRFAASRTMYAPSRLSSARESSRPPGNSTGGPVQTPASPTRTSASASARSLAPMSTWRSACSRRPRSRICSGGSRLRPIVPITSPSRVRNLIRWPSSVSGLIPPIVVTRSSPPSSTAVIATPISSMWPTRASAGASTPPAAATRAKVVPSVSDETVANAAAASRQMCDASSSCPEGPKAWSSEMSRSGTATRACAFKRNRLPSRSMNLRTRIWWRSRRERGGSPGA